MLPVNFFGEATSSKEIYGSLIYDCIIPSNVDNLCQQVHENKQTYSWRNEENYTAFWKDL